MNRELRTLKRSVTQAIDDTRLEMREFRRHREWEAFLFDADDRSRAPHELAAYALDYLCEGDRSKLDGVVCLGVINFLCCYSQPGSADLCELLEDLRQLTVNPASYDAYLQWIRARF